MGALTPRQVAGLLATPGCERRARLAGVVAEDAAQSPFALARGAQFRRMVESDRYAHLLALAGTHLGPGPWTVDPIPTITSQDRHNFLQTVALDGSTGHVLLRNVRGDAHVVEVRTYAMVDGQADPAKVAATSREIAVVIATLRDGGLDVSPRALLVLPKNFGLYPTGAVLDVTPQLARVAYLSIPPEADLADLDSLPRRFGDGCADCQFFDHCAGQEHGLVDRLGDTVTNLCGTGTPVAVALADPPPDHTTILRLRAAVSGRAEPRATVRHAHLAERPFTVTGYHLAGEPAAVVALRYGTSPGDAKLLVAADPRRHGDRIAMMREFAADLTSYLDGFTAVEPVVRRDFTVVECAVDAPQIVTPNAATAAWLTDLLGRYLRGSEDPNVILAGQHLGWASHRRALPGSCAVVTATGLLGTHWATGQLASEDGHLASILAWVDPAGPRPDQPAGPVSDPGWDASSLSAALGDERAVRAAVEDELAPAWRDTWRALDLVRGTFMQVGAHVAERWESDRWSFTAHRTRMADGTAAFAAKLQGIPAYRFLHELETRTAALDRQMALDDPLVMEAYLVSGEALTGQVVKVDREHTVTAPSGRELLRPRIWVNVTGAFTRPVGTELWLAEDPRVQVSVAAIEVDTVELLVEKGAVQRAALSRLPEPGAQVVFAPFGSEDLFPSRLPDQLPWQFGEPDAG
jgi:hypothetical protein